MEWLNPPPSWKAEGSTLTVTVGAKTDAWREPRGGAVRDSAHFYHQQQTGDFTADVKITANYGALYDQAGLMVRLDEKVWIKCGVELLDGVQQASAVVTRDFSDWSIVAMPQNPPVFWLRVERIGSSVEVRYSLDGANYILIRAAYLTPAETVSVGPMCAAPQGDGFTAMFEGFTVRAKSG